MDLKVAKFLIMGTVLGCLESTLTIAACMSSKPIFLNPPDKRDEAKAWVFMSQLDDKILKRCVIL